MYVWKVSCEGYYACGESVCVRHSAVGTDNTGSRKGMGFRLGQELDLKPKLHDLEQVI